jgi:hypothetical protein
MGPFWTLLKKEFGGIPISMMWMSADDDYVDAWYKFSQDESGEYSAQFMKLEGNFPLYLALIFSLYWDFLAE